MTSFKNMFKGIIAISMLSMLTSCISTDEVVETRPSVLISSSVKQDPESVQKESTATLGVEEEQPETAEAIVHHGTGQFIATPLKGEAAQKDELGDITLNFHNTDLQEVTKVILGDILNVNYLIDPKATGTVSLQTSKPVTKSSILPMFESILRINQLALVKKDNGYHIMPLRQATYASTPNIGRRTGPGFTIQVIPLEFISAKEMEKILTPVVAKEAFVLVDNRRNLLMLAGTSQELTSWLETIRLFDVDWLSGQSFGLFPLNHSSTSEIIKEIQLILGAGSEGLSPELVTIHPLERMNTLMVITSQPHYLEKIRKWIERLDMAGSFPGKGLFVYKVKNRKAADLADVINNVFISSGSTSASRAKTPAQLAPGMKPVTLKTSPDGKTSTVAAKPAVNRNIPLISGPLDVRVVADEQKNAILVMASAEEYRIIESALRRLDTLPLQVIIEVSIIDVILTDDLQYGVEWYFKNTIDGKSGSGGLNFGSAVTPSAIGFSYSLVDSDGLVRAVLNALAEESKINVISSPSLMVLDNNTAEIQVGNQQPIQTESVIVDGEIVESIEYKDTGVKLEVTPNVNPGGLVTMTVSQEVTDVGEIDDATGQRSFLQRLVNSTVAVKNGQTIVLGGLITENDTVTESGIPVLYKIPVVGKLFGSTISNNTRNELLILLTPRVVEKPKDASGVLDEYRESMKNLRENWLPSEAAIEKPATLN